MSRFFMEADGDPDPGRQAAEEPVERSTQAPDAIDSAHAEPRVVLFVEDRQANIRLMDRILRRRPGVHMISAPDGAHALRLLRETVPDLVLLDLNLPDMPGEVILRQLRGDPATGAVPVVVISGDSLPAVVDRAMELGATAFITKPFAVTELLRLVDRLLDRPAPD